MDRVTTSMKVMAPKLDESMKSGVGAAQAIMTTGTKKKEVAVRVGLGGKTVIIGGMRRGSGMIHPNTYTMLAFMAMDVTIPKELLQEALDEDIQDIYNIISVDGGTSTNDTMLLLTNEMSENLEITKENKDHKAFERVLSYVNETLMKEMAEDGEGRTTLFEVTVVGMEGKERTKILAKSVITPSLIKAAILGHDVN